MAITERVTVSFVVRLTKEPREVESSEVPDTWRGLVQHIQSGNELRFVQLKDLFEFIESYVEPTSK